MVSDRLTVRAHLETVFLLQCDPGVCGPALLFPLVTVFGYPMPDSDEQDHITKSLVQTTTTVVFSFSRDFPCFCFAQACSVVFQIKL